MEIEPALKTSQSSRVFTSRKGVAFTLLVAFIIAALDKLNMGLFIADGQFLQDLGLTGKSVQIGLLMSTFLFAYAFGFLLCGYLVDKLGAYRVLLTGCIIWGILEGLQGLVQTAGQMYTIRVFLGISEAAIWPSSFVLIAKWFPLSERARANSIWLNGLNIAAIGIALTTISIAALGWRMTFVLTGLAHLVILVPMLLWFVAETPAQFRRISREEREYIETAQAEEKAQIKIPAQNEFKRVLADYKFWLISVTWALHTLVYFTLNTWFAAYLKQERDMSIVSSGLTMAFSLLVGVYLMVLAGRLSDRWKRRAPISMIGYSLAVICVFLTLGVQSPYASALFLSLVLIFLNSSSIGTETIMHQMGSAEVLGKLSGVHLTFTNIISALGPTLFGTLIVLFGGDFSAGFYSLILFFLIMIAITGVFMKKGY